MQIPDANKIENVARILGQTRSILFITGAGISADSGLPTYRGIGGLYDGHGTDEGISIEQALSAEMIARQPEVTWKYIHQIEQSCRGARYNRGHEVIAEMEKHFDRVWTLTQNIDGFHHKAGSKNVIDIHGDIYHLKCVACTYCTVVQDYSGIDIVPPCPMCKGYLRPDVVLFGESLSPEKSMKLWQELDRGFDVVFSIGTTSVFPYISEPVYEAKRRGNPTVEINPGVTNISQVVDFRFVSPAAQTLDAIWSALGQRRL